MTRKECTLRHAFDGYPLCPAGAGSTFPDNAPCPHCTTWGPRINLLCSCSPIRESRSEPTPLPDSRSLGEVIAEIERDLEAGFESVGVANARRLIAEIASQRERINGLMKLVLEKDTALPISATQKGE